MFSVIVIDDEPTALNHICTIIRLKCPEFEILATAENGQEGLEKVCKYQPDVVITDIKMPIMTGVEMVQRLCQMKSETYAIIISGYQEFEYAKSALKAGVVDYLLKPIIPSDIKEVLEKIQVMLQNKAYKNRNQLIKELFLGEKVEDEQIKRYFSSPLYYGAIVRRNGLPRRFSRSEAIELFSFVEDVVFSYGRDDMEALYLCPEEVIEQKAFEELIKHEIDKKYNETDYITCVVYKEAFEPKQIPKIAKKLYRTLDSHTVIGYSQIITIGDTGIATQHTTVNEEQVIKQIEYHLSKQQIDKVFGVITQFMKECERVKYPQLLLEEVVRKILYVIQKYDKVRGNCNNCEFMLEDAFYYATNMKDLLESLQDIYEKYVQQEEVIAKVDTPEFLEKIKDYIQANMGEDISLPSICRTFGISQTYLSRLFRKYEQNSFNNYLTTLRIEKAKELLRENEGIFIKDVANMIGYKDQFYFSRIFRSIVGVCPSDYHGDKDLLL